MVQPGATNEVALSCCSNATGRPQALSRRNTLQVVALASRPLSGMMSCLAPSPAVMSSLATSATRSERPAIETIFLVLPSAMALPSEYFEVWRSAVCTFTGAVLLLSAGRRPLRPSLSKANGARFEGADPALACDSQWRTQDQSGRLNLLRPAALMTLAYFADLIGRNLPKSAVAPHGFRSAPALRLRPLAGLLEPGAPVFPGTRLRPRFQVAVPGLLGFALGERARRHAGLLHVELKLGVAVAVDGAEHELGEVAPGDVDAVPTQQLQPVRAERLRTGAALLRRDDEERGVAELVARIPERHLLADLRAHVIERKERRAGIAERQERLAVMMRDGIDVGTRAIDLAVNDAFAVAHDALGQRLHRLGVEVVFVDVARL